MSAPHAALPIRSVVVHPDGALVTRAGRASYSGSEILVRDLPLLLEPGSVRARVTGIGGSNPARGVYTELDLLGEDRGDAPSSLERLIAAKQDISRLSAQRSALELLRSALSSLVPAQSPDPERPIPSPERFTSWLAANQAAIDKIAAIDGELRALDEARRQKSEQHSLLERLVRQESSEAWWKRWQPTRRVRIELDPGHPPTEALEVELSYQIPGASWSPAYVLEADKALSKGRFAMRALVVQATGEDWRSVALSLSSAPCERAVDVPELASLRLGPRQRERASGWRELPAGLESLFPADLGQTLPSGGEIVQEVSIETRKKQDRIDDLEYDHDDTNPMMAPLDEEANLRTETEAYPLMPAPKSARGGGGLLSSMLDAIPMPQARPSALPLSADVSRGPAKPLLQQRRQKAEEQGRLSGKRLAPEPEPRDLDVGGDWLDYGRLRLVGLDGRPGLRGTLQPVDEFELLREAKLPPDALSRFSERRAELSEGCRRTKDRPLPPQHVLPAPISGSDARIDAVGSVDIPSDGRTHSVAVSSWEASLTVSYRAVPRHDPRAFRIVIATVAYSRPLLPGPVDIYVDGKLELTSAWSGSPGRGQLVIGLGAEDRLTLARNVRYREEVAGMLGGSRKIITTIEVSAASTLPHPVTIELLERLPVPLDGRSIAVEPLEASPQATPYKGETDGPLLKGGRSQILRIAPSGEAKALLSYAVTLPKGEELVGGDHRG